jgi:hypothetical protein
MGLTTQRKASAILIAVVVYVLFIVTCHVQFNLCMARVKAEAAKANYNVVACVRDRPDSFLFARRRATGDVQSGKIALKRAIGSYHGKSY